MKHVFLYYLKLWDGQLLHAEGCDPEEAAAAAGVAFAKVKRHMPVKKILTPEERAAQAAKFEALRNRGIES